MKIELLPRTAAMDLKYNPKESFRPGQIAAVTSLWGAVHNDYKILALDGRTGSGKTIIASVLGNLLGSSDILTTQIKLQNQYIAVDPKHKKVEGRRNFTCRSNRSKTADRGECITGSDNFVCKYKPVNGGKYPAYGEKGWRHEKLEDRCPYWVNVEDGVKADHTVFNYPYYVLKKNIPQCEFSRKPLQILDEGHNLESYLREVNSFEIHDLGLYHVRHIPGVDFKEYFEYDQVPLDIIKGIPEAIKWLTELSVLVELRITDTEIARKNGRDGLKRRAQMLKSLDDRIEGLLHYYQKNPNNWVISLDKDGFKLIPLYIGDYIHPTLLRHSDIALIMSATLPRKDLLCKRLGLAPEEVFYYHMASTFPPENAPIYSYPQPTMNYERGGMEKKRDIMGGVLGRLMQKYEDDRGLILCNSFAEVDHYSKYISERFPQYANRMVIHRKGDNTEYLLDDHYAISDGVIITPSMWEGEDFINERARFLAIAKVPFEDTKDSVVEGWMKRDKSRYFQNACQKLIQGIGRVVRSQEDYADIHICDGAFRRLFKYNRKEFPEEIQDRVVYL